MTTSASTGSRGGGNDDMTKAAAMPTVVAASVKEAAMMGAWEGVGRNNDDASKAAATMMTAAAMIVDILLTVGGGQQLSKSRNESCAMTTRPITFPCLVRSAAQVCLPELMTLACCYLSRIDQTGAIQSDIVHLDKTWTLWMMGHTINDADVS